MPKLNQILAVEKTRKNNAIKALETAYHTIQKPVLFVGQERTYQPKDDEGEKYPAEPVRVQARVSEIMATVALELQGLWDLIATKDSANQQAAADIRIGETVLARQVPVTTLLTLEKGLTDLHTFITKAPVADPSETWTRDENLNAYRGEPIFTLKTKKLPKPFVKAAATDKHPAQVEVVHEDVTVGTWTTVRLTGALSANDQRLLLHKIQELQAAVKQAREEANLTEAPKVEIAAAIFNYLGWLPQS